MEKEKVVNLLPTSISRQIGFTKRKFCLFASAAILAFAPLPSAFQYYMQKIMIEQEKTSLTQRIEQMKKSHLQMNEAFAAISEDAMRVQSLQILQKNRSNWILLLADLQNLLQEVKDTWLVSLELDEETSRGRPLGPRIGPNAPSEARGVLNFSGDLLIRDDKIEEASKRVNRLIKSFKRSSFIDAVLEQDLDPDNKRILKFKFAVALNPQKPL